MKKFGVLGFPVRHSLSPVMYNAAFKEVGFEGFYEFCEVEPEKLNCFMKRVKTAEYTGLSVTVPYKEKVLEYCDSLSEFANKIGAVNLLYFRNGKLIGDNSDWFGFIMALSEVLPDLANKKILILGAGGAARACIYALNNVGIKPFVANRTIQKAIDLEPEFDIEVAQFSDLPSADVVVNCTSVGLNPEDDLVLSVEYLKEGVEVVFDLIYKETKLFLEAKKIGLKLVDAKRMLLWQAVRQFEKFTEKKAPVEVMWESIKSL